MSQKKSGQNVRISPSVKISASVLVSIILCGFLFAVIYKLTSFSSHDFLPFLHIILVLILVLIAYVLIMTCIMAGIYKHKLKIMGAIKNFRDFINLLQCTSTEVDAFETIISFLLEQKMADSISLFYKENPADKESAWYINLSGTPVCSFPPCSCSLNKYLQDFHVEDIRTGKCCGCAYPELKSGSYIYICALSNEYSHAILQFYSSKKKFFTPQIIYIIKSFIDIANPIVSSKQALHILTKKAATDGLTRVYNRDFLDPYLENQLEASEMSKRPVSLIMVDMDNFKDINDTFGHIVGDHVLTVFSDILLKCIRKTDLVARYGGDEFIVVLPSTDTDIAHIVAQRIICEVSAAKIPPLDNAVIPSISCSIGISTYPVYCSSKDSLVKTADIALYKAKQSGKNCAKVYTPC